MTLMTVAVKNLQHRATRSVLTVVGIAVGVAAAVAISSVVRGIGDAWVRVYAARGTDLVVARSGHLNPSPPLFDENEARNVAAIAGVSDVAGAMTEIVSIEDTPIVLVFGWQPHSFLWTHIRMRDGRLPNDGAHEVIVGTVAMDMLEKHVASTLNIDGGSFTIVGTFDSGSLAESGAVVMPLPDLQRISDHRGKIDFLNVKLGTNASSSDIERVRHAVVERMPGFKALTTAEVADTNSAVRAGSAISDAVTVLALIVGAVCVANTMLMSVFERMQELGLLLAVGWSRRRVVRLILLESLMLAAAGGIAGVTLGLAAVSALQQTSLLRGKLEDGSPLAIVTLAFLLSIALGTLGGVYPAYRGARLQPSEALRWE